MAAVPTGVMKGKSLGEFGLRGGSIVYVEWSPSPQQVERAFMWLADYFDGVELPLMEAQKIAMYDTARRFETETDPDDHAWEPLDPDYLEYKSAQGYMTTILSRKGNLRDAAPQGWHVVGHSLWYDPSVLPTADDGTNYGLVHQRGAGYAEDIGVAGAHRAASFASRGKNVYITDAREARPSQGGEPGELIGTGRALPQRSFIGLSLDALELIEAAFVEWFDVGIETMPWGDETYFAPEPTRPTHAYGPSKYGGGLMPLAGQTKRGQPIVRTPHGPRFGKGNIGLGL